MQVQPLVGELRSYMLHGVTNPPPPKKPKQTEKPKTPHPPVMATFFKKPLQVLNTDLDSISARQKAAPWSYTLVASLETAQVTRAAVSPECRALERPDRRGFVP